MNQQLANNHISVDCVVVGFDGERFKVLLVNRDGAATFGEEFPTKKLPGSLIYQDEDLDEAALRVLHELTGLNQVELVQFRTYGSKDRTSDPCDVIWLERAQQAKVERIVTVAYVALVKIGSRIKLDPSRATWVDIDSVPPLAFDHNIIVADAISAMRTHVETSPARIFDLLPRKFTAAQLRSLYSLVLGHEVDARNFHKKMSMMDYVVALDEKEKGVAHRAARYYRFDRKIYNKGRR